MVLLKDYTESRIKGAWERHAAFAVENRWFKLAIIRILCWKR